MYATLRLPLAAVAVAALAALAAAVDVAAPAWAIVAAANAALLGLLAFDVRGAPHASELQLRRAVPPVLSVARSDEVHLRLHNPTDRPLTMGIRDASPPSFRRRPLRHTITVDPGSWAVVVAELRPARRGKMTIGPVTVRTSGPMGLGGRQATVPLVDAVKVYPVMPARAEIQLRLERARLLQTGERSSALRGGGTDFDSLRDYHPDDEFRRINWRATARAAKPITNLYREERNQQVLLILDAGRFMAGTIGGFPRFEHAVDAAVAVAELSGRIGDQVGMAAFDGRIRALVAPRGGREQARRILAALFDLEPSLQAADYAGAFAGVLARHRRRSLLILLTELADEAVLEPLLRALPALLRRHLVIVGSVTDPDVEAMARAEPSSSEDAYLKATALAAMSGRRRASSRLTRMGVVVVDQPPRIFAGRLADQYLRIKAAGRL